MQGVDNNMHCYSFDVVSKKDSYNGYGGIERCLEIKDCPLPILSIFQRIKLHIKRILFKEDKPKDEKKFDDFLDIYFQYLDWYLDTYNEFEADKELETNKEFGTYFKKVIEFYKKFQDFNIPCEVILCVDNTIENVFGYSVELLGIDIMNDSMYESLFNDEIHTNISNFINENKLCKKEEYIEKIIPWQSLSWQDRETTKWLSCYVYKVLI